MSGVILAFFVSAGGGAGVVADGTFSGAPLSDGSFGG